MSLTELNVPILPVVSNAHICSSYLETDVLSHCTYTIYTGNNLLKCDPRGLFPGTVSEDCSDGLCVMFSSTSVGDIATYFTTSDYCINSTSGLDFTRECLDNGMWSGNVPIKHIGNHSYTNTVFTWIKVCADVHIR